MKFVSLHHHTTFSYKDGYGTPERHVGRAAELEMAALAVTEHGNVSSHVQLEKAALATGVKPIFGCELYCGDVGEGRSQKKNHLTVLAENQEGYRNLLRVVSRGWSEGFYYEPTVSGGMLRDHREGLVVLSGCTGSLLSTSMVGGKNVAPEDASYRRAFAVAQRFQRTFGEGYYLEVQAFPELPNVRTINQGIVRISKALSIPLVATLDCHYTRPEDSEMQQILHNIRGGARKSMEEQARSWGYDVKLAPPITDQLVVEKLMACGLRRRDAEEAVANTHAIAQRCTVTLPKIEALRYPLAGTEADSAVALFRRWCKEGWAYRDIDKRPERRRYVQQVKHEMALIEEKDFVDYFLVVSDAVRFAKDSGIPVGPARGSAAASLVCYLLRITEVDPIPFPTLLFERFIDRNRHDLPDIDLDFDDERRHEVRDYLVAKYGADRVGNIGTFTKFKGKNSLEDVARAFRLPKWEIDTVKELLIERSSGDLRAAATIEDTVEMFPEVRRIFEKYPELNNAMRLEGNVRGMSVHAAGLVIANEPLTNACAVYCKIDQKTGLPALDGDGLPQEVISLDKYDAEYLNVLKLDALGLKTMGMIRLALEHIGMTLEELYALPLTDQETITGFQRSDVVGVFQFDGRAMRSVNAGVIPDNFFEICDVNALARPGPLHSGATADYIDVKHGRKPATHYNKIVDDITVHTNFQIVYQEQILQVVRNLGNFSWEEAARIRKIISKKRGEQEFNTQRAKFVEGAKTHGLSAGDADKVFSLLATAGAYAFNAAHCVSYGMLAYWTMWLKRHHPDAFYLGCLRKFPDKRNQLLRDALNHDISVGKLALNKSQINWSWDPEDRCLRPGLTSVKGIGESMGTKILTAREDAGGKFDGWGHMLGIKGLGEAKVKSLKDFQADPDPFELDLLRTKVQRVKDDIVSGRLKDGVFWLPEPTHTAAEVPYERTEANVDVCWLGVVRERNLKDLFENYFSRTGEQLDPHDVKRPDLKEWTVMTCEDATDILVVTMGRYNYPQWKDMIWALRPNHDLVLVRGTKLKDQSRRAIYAKWMCVIDPDAEGDGDDES